MNTTMKYGLTAGLAYIVFTLALYFLGMEKSQGMGMIGYLILLGAQFLGVKEIRDAEQDGYITFGTAWKKGVFIALIAGLLGSIYMMIHLSYINPEMLQEVLTEAEVQMEESGASSEEIEMGMKMAGMFGEISESIAEEKGMSTFFWILTGISLVLSILAYLTTPIFKKLMHGVK